MLEILKIFITKKGCRTMVDLYCALIIAGKRTIETVPKQLAAVGLDENGDTINYTNE